MNMHHLPMKSARLGHNYDIVVFYPSQRGARPEFSIPGWHQLVHSKKVQAASQGWRYGIQIRAARSGNGGGETI